jgi:hypothetical protein
MDVLPVLVVRWENPISKPIMSSLVSFLMGFLFFWLTSLLTLLVHGQALRLVRFVFVTWALYPTDCTIFPPQSLMVDTSWNSSHQRHLLYICIANSLVWIMDVYNDISTNNMGLKNPNY